MNYWSRLRIQAALQSRQWRLFTRTNKIKSIAAVNHVVSLYFLQPLEQLSHPTILKLDEKQAFGLVARRHATFRGWRFSRAFAYVAGFAIAEENKGLFVVYILTCLKVLYV